MTLDALSTRKLSSSGQTDIMFVKKRTHLLASCLIVLTFILSTGCSDASVYMCDTTEIAATETPINLVAPRASLNGTGEGVSCAIFVKFTAGQTVLVTLNAWLSITSCDAEDYVQFSDEAHTSPKYCNGPAGATLFISQQSSMTITYRSNYGQSFMNVSIAPAFCLPPPAILNGWYMASDTRYTLRSTIKYACNTGYELSVNRTRQCIVENEARLIWSEVTPSCDAETQAGGFGSLTNAKFYGIISASVIVALATTFTAALVCALKDKKRNRANRLTKPGGYIKL